MVYVGIPNNSGTNLKLVITMPIPTPAIKPVMNLKLLLLSLQLKY